MDWIFSIIDGEGEGSGMGKADNGDRIDMFEEEYTEDGMKNQGDRYRLSNNLSLTLKNPRPPGTLLIASKKALVSSGIAPGMLHAGFMFRGMDPDPAVTIAGRAQRWRDDGRGLWTSRESRIHRSLLPVMPPVGI